MPQMAPLLWLNLFFFFLMSLMLVLTLNFFIKPFEIMYSSKSLQPFPPKPWKL